MAVETVNYQCPSCAGPLHFDEEAGKLKCDHCDSLFTAQEAEAYYAAKQQKADAAGEAVQANSTEEERAASAADPINEYLKRSQWSNAEAEKLVSYTCSSCGAELTCDVTTAVTSCPYCGNPTVVPGKLGGMLRPDYVIPFKKTKEEAVAALAEYYKGKRFLPKAFIEGNHLEDIQGVYVPFWLYGGNVSGDAVFDATDVRTWSDGRYAYTETSRFSLARSGRLEFENVPADGSVKMPDAHMDAIEPYDYSEMQPFSVGYLAGFLADRFDVDAADCRKRIEPRVSQSLSQSLSTTTGAHQSVSLASFQGEITCTQVSYALLPVWMLHTRFEGEDYLFAMNGQTGKMVGDLPVSKGKFAAWFAGLGVGFTALIAVLLYVALKIVESA